MGEEAEHILALTQDQSDRGTTIWKVVCQHWCHSRRAGGDLPISSKCFSLKLIHHTLISLARASHVAAPNFREVEKCTFPMNLEEKGVGAVSVCRTHLRVPGRTEWSNEVPTRVLGFVRAQS